MAQLDPVNTSAGDICAAALKECGAIGVGQTPLAEDSNDAQARLQWMLQQWERKRRLVYHLETFSVTSTGAVSYTVGPLGDINTGPSSVRPNRVESAFLRQVTQSQPNQIDMPLEIIQAREDYNRIRLKQLQAFTEYLYYDPAWPLGVAYPWPVPNPTIYEIHCTVRAQLPQRFLTSAIKFALPYEYYAAMVYNLALRLRPKYRIGTFPGDTLPGMAKDSLNVLRTGNAQIGRLLMPADLTRDGNYNIFSDRSY